MTSVWKNTWSGNLVIWSSSLCIDGAKSQSTVIAWDLSSQGPLCHFQTKGKGEFFYNPSWFSKIRALLPLYVNAELAAEFLQFSCCRDEILFINFSRYLLTALFKMVLIHPQCHFFIFSASPALSKSQLIPLLLNSTFTISPKYKYFLSLWIHPRSFSNAVMCTGGIIFWQFPCVSMF
jgi:hypothetical protein